VASLSITHETASLTPGGPAGGAGAGAGRLPGPGGCEAERRVQRGAGHGAGHGPRVCRSRDLGVFELPGSPKQRVERTLAHMFGPVLHGGLSTLLGLTMLALVEFDFVFR